MDRVAQATALEMVAMVDTVSGEAVDATIVVKRDINHVSVRNLNRRDHVVATIVVKKVIVKPNVLKAQEVVVVMAAKVVAAAAAVVDQPASSAVKLATCPGIVTSKVEPIILATNHAINAVKLDTLPSTVPIPTHQLRRSVTSVVLMNTSWLNVPSSIQVTLMTCHLLNVTYVRKKDTWLATVPRARMAFIQKVPAGAMAAVLWIILYVTVL